MQRVVVVFGFGASVSAQPFFVCFFTKVHPARLFCQGRFWSGFFTKSLDCRMCLLLFCNLEAGSVDVESVSCVCMFLISHYFLYFLGGVFVGV